MRWKMVAKSYPFGVGLRGKPGLHFGLTRTTPKSDRFSMMVSGDIDALKQANSGAHQLDNVAVNTLIVA